MYDRNKVIRFAQNEIGYLEKSEAAYRENPAILYSKTGGAGYDNYTKYGKVMHQLYPSVMDFPASWCDTFVDYCFYSCYGVATAKSLLGGDFNDYTVASAQMYQKHGALDHTPEVGTQVFYSRNGQVSGIYHTGLVETVSADGKTITTIEGNTSATGSGIVANGGCVARKMRTVTSTMFFGHPAYNDGFDQKQTSPQQEKKESTAVNQYAAIVKLNSDNSILNVRTGAGTNYPVLLRQGRQFFLINGMVVSIEKESSGWGKLTGVDGWISLAYVKK